MKRLFASILFASLASAGCASDSSDPAAGHRVKGEGDLKGDASAEAVFVEFSFEGEVETDYVFDADQVIQDQMLYTIGHLNGDRAVGRLDKLVLEDVQVSSISGGRKRLSYRATLPVAWGDKDDFPTTYAFKLPRDISYSGQEAFTEKYKDECIDWSAHDVDSGSMWYYYRPAHCQLDDADVVQLTAAVTLSDTNTTGKFPEYDKVWEDGELRVVAIFGKYEDGATTSSDAGIAAFNTFSRAVRSQLSGAVLTTTPAQIPSNPGVEMPELRFQATLPDGRKVNVDALLVDNVRTAGAEFDSRYAELSGTADLIIYNGHAGLGANVRALAQKGDWLPGQYKMVFMNGCDTYAYVDGAIVAAHAAINPDDPIGTKYVDMITNALPSFFSSMSSASMALIRALLAVDEPQTYEQMFAAVDRAQVILVHGEEDNSFVPGGGGDPDGDWAGMSESGTVRRAGSSYDEHRFETPTVPAGRYTFAITGTGDADLYVRIGQEPSASRYDCRPYLDGSAEQCVIDLAAPSTLHVMVRAYAAESSYQLTGSRD